MSFRRGLVLLSGLMVGLSGCRKTPEAKAAQLRELEQTRARQVAQRLARADADPDKNKPVASWIMPPELREISGLTMLPNGHLLAHDDEVARIYDIDPKTGVIMKSFTLDNARHGDFEAITTAGTDIYLLESNGKLYRFKAGNPDKEVPYSVYDTHLGKECEFESLAYETDSSWLLLACKKVTSKNLDHQLVIYRLSVPLTDSAKYTTLTIPLGEVIGGNKWKHFHPSDLAIDPATGNYVLIASKEQGLAVITPDGDVVRSEPLPKGHNQAEGVAITRDSLLVISDEATHKPADITLYRWRQ
jgi:uncharacterized protein YjiK